MDYIEFVKEYLDLACRYADAAICRHVQKHGALNSRIDVDLVKDLAVETALSKVFYNYDSERAKKANAQFSTFLNKVVNNCVLNELTAEGRALKRGGLLNGHETELDNSTPGAGKSGNDGRFFEPYTYNAWERGDKLQAEIQAERNGYEQAVNASGIRQDTYRLPVIFFQSSGYQLH